ncbi:ribonuclease III [Fusobacterium perfoetens]|uniref:ribonuclease III n=1 Tax=Fusobacterium perfoetens TaxID=852 RepID=UPI000568C49B|nr:ribonuclease III [Fusobacterium perfoetens]MCI6151702.1 ribonuclease III [Fusobacterium perfoetens]MDY3236542.1 ribonuclease III [Fusobacterium perfoetens]
MEVDFKIDLSSLEKKIGYKFKNIKLLRNSLVHRSFGNENKKYKKINNERLELLGDAVLDLIVAEYLYKNHSNYSEGDLAKIKSMAVSEPVLAKVSRKLNMGEYLYLSRGELLTGGRERNSILGDLFEAVLGAIYLDSNFETARKIALHHLKEYIDHVEEDEEIMDFKTILQEYSQKVYKQVPTYEVINETGPDHKKLFEIVVKIGEDIEEKGIGKSKKMAEHGAAQALCKKLGVKY